jgi:hypothetical protein
MQCIYPRPFTWVGDLPINRPTNLHLDARQVPSSAAAIDHWLAARDKFKIEPNGEGQSDYETTPNDLRVAWANGTSEDADTPEAFEWYRHGLIASEEE